MTTDNKSALDIVHGLSDAHEGSIMQNRRAAEKRIHAHYYTVHDRFHTLHAEKAKREQEQTNAANAGFVQQVAVWKGTLVTPFQQPVAKVEMGFTAQRIEEVLPCQIQEETAPLTGFKKRWAVLMQLAGLLNEYTDLLNEEDAEDPSDHVQEGRRVAQMFAIAALETAHAAGLDLDIERRPVGHAMGSFVSAIIIGETNKVYRARFAAEAEAKHAQAEQEDRTAMGEPDCTCASNPHAENCPVTYFVRELFANSGECAQALVEEGSSIPFGVLDELPAAINPCTETPAMLAKRIVLGKDAEQIIVPQEPFTEPVAMGHPYLPYPSKEETMYIPV
jgi:hypothetical protein